MYCTHRIECKTENIAASFKKYLLSFFLLKRYSVSFWTLSIFVVISKYTLTQKHLIEALEIWTVSLNHCARWNDVTFQMSVENTEWRQQQQQQRQQKADKTHIGSYIHMHTFVYITIYKLEETHRETSTQSKMDLERSATYETYGWFGEYITRNTFFFLFVVDDFIFETTEWNLC